MRAAEAAYGVDKRWNHGHPAGGKPAGNRVRKPLRSEHPVHPGRLTDPAFQEIFWHIIPPERRITRERFNERVQKRAEWGYRELRALLALRRAGRGSDPALIVGSYAGAVGYAQFMPTNLLAYARTATRTACFALPACARRTSLPPCGSLSP